MISIKLLQGYILLTNGTLKMLKSQCLFRRKLSCQIQLKYLDRGLSEVKTQVRWCRMWHLISVCTVSEAFLMSIWWQYWNDYYFSIKTYCVYSLEVLSEALLMSTHNISFYEALLISTQNISFYEALLISTNISFYEALLISTNISFYEALLISTNISFYEALSMSTQKISFYEALLMSTHNISFYEALLISTNNISFYEALLMSTHNIYMFLWRVRKKNITELSSNDSSFRSFLTVCHSSINI